LFGFLSAYTVWPCLRNADLDQCDTANPTVGAGDEVKGS
jgi:hypothetical protein